MIPGLPGRSLTDYAVIDPKGTVQEMHTDNNKAYAQLPVVQPGDPAPPTTLSVTSADITFDPETPTAGEPVRIAARVQARGDTSPTWRWTSGTGNRAAAAGGSAGR